MRPPKLILLRRTARLGHGFTLLESLLALLLISLILMGTMNLMTSASSWTASTQARISATQTAANAMQRVINDAREANAVVTLGPTVSGVSTMDGTNATGVTLGYPGTHAAVTVALASAGTRILPNASPATQAIYDKTVAGPTLTLYRSDKDGTPNPRAGQYLWMIGTEPGRAATTATGQKLAQLADTAAAAAAIPDAVQFSQTAGDAQELLLRIVSSYYSPVNRVQSSESSGTTELTAKAVLLRN